ncbi:MAG: Hsp20/alpha crystallin family protein [Bacillota bacterium]
MTLVRWEPFRELVNLKNTINSLFDENFRRVVHPEMGTASQGWTFPIDIKETPEDIRIKAEIPGVKREDIKVSYDNNVLTIRGERKNEEKEEGADFIRVERRYGSFSRSFFVDIPVKTDQIKAGYKDGILEVTLPKDQPESKEIKIQIEG